MRVFLSCASAAFGLMVSPVAYAADAAFLGKSTYTSSTDDCSKLQAIARGTLKPSLTSVPETLSAKGYKSWEGACTVASTKPNRVDRRLASKAGLSTSYAEKAL
jgi:hypothetical protein